MKTKLWFDFDISDVETEVIGSSQVFKQKFIDFRLNVSC